MKEYIDYDMSGLHEMSIMPYVSQILDKCYDMKLPVLYLAAVKNSISDTVYSGAIITPETYNMSLSPDFTKGYPDEMYVTYDQIEAKNIFDKKAALDKELGQALEYLKALNYMSNIPFVIMIPFSNSENKTCYWGKALYPDVKHIKLADNKFKDLIFKINNYSQLGSFF